MPSIIERYNYDIFVSYRQKDNKHDGWVTEFVDNLKGELESTFKEEVSVYFDINPNDGLLETHDVDASLKDKLKCLVFIPIISQTYCDSGSFAWRNEFCAFNKLAKEDKFGRDIKLASGNVGSRILPVKIHDLDAEDKTLLENELGGVLRGVEFIYKSTGVNRPLKPNDNPDKNLNSTYYRDQINKVANAVKEIISALKKQIQRAEDVSKKDLMAKSSSQKNVKSRIIIASVITFALIVLGYFLIPTLSKPKEQIEKSIAVLPFENLSSDKEQAWFSDGITDIIITQLSKISDLRVVSRTSTLKYREGGKSISELGNELGVNYIIEGTVQRQVNKMRINVQMIRVRNEGHMWSNIYDREWKDIFSIQSDIAFRIAEELRTVLTPREKELIAKEQTKNPEAYNLYLQGRFFWHKRTEETLKKSVEYFEKSVAEDPEYASAYAGLADSYYIITLYGWMPRAEGVSKAKGFAYHALDLDKNLAEAHTTLGNIFYWSEWNWDAARNELTHAITLNPNYSIAYMSYTELLDIIGQTDEAIVQINHAIVNDPLISLLHAASAIFYYNVGKNKESLEANLKTIEINPDYYQYTYRLLFLNYIKLGEGWKAVEALQKIMPGDIGNLKEAYNKSGTYGLLKYLVEWELKKPEPSFIELARWYALLGRKDKALDWLEKAFKERYFFLPRINTNPDFDNIRSEPRFQEIIKQMGLSAYQKVK
jgi:TolB-like protein